MSKEAGHQSHNLLKTIAWITETMTFVYIGLCLFTQEFSGWDFGAMGVALMLCLVGRVFNVFPISYFANKGRVQKITRNMQLVLWFSGLRGAIAFSLSLDLPNPFGTWDNDYVATTTLGGMCSPAVAALVAVALTCARCSRVLHYPGFRERHGARAHSRWHEAGCCCY